MLSTKYLAFAYLIFIIVIVLGSISSDSFRNRKNPDNYLSNVTVNIGYSLVLLVIISKFYSYKKESVKFNVLKVIGLLIVFDALFYWSHIIMHRVPWLKKRLHETHHKNIDLVPLDFLYEGILSVLVNSCLYFVLPCLTLTFIETVAYLAIIIIHLAYTHSDTSLEFPIPLFINARYHSLHHTIGGGNYGLLFSFWDDYMNTRIKDPTKHKMKRKKKKKQKLSKLVS